MAEYILTTPTAVPVGGIIPFTEQYSGKCSIIHRVGSGNVTLRSCSCGSRYMAHFHANVTGVAGTITLGIYQDGELIPFTEMNVVPAAADDVLSVDAVAEIPVYCTDVTISVRVVAGTGVTVNNAVLIVGKEG